MTFVLRLAVTSRELGTVLEGLLKNADVKLLDCQLAERATPTPKLPKEQRISNASEVLQKIITEAFEIGVEFTPKTILPIVRRKMKEGTFYGKLKWLVEKGIIEHRRPGFYARIK